MQLAGPWATSSIHAVWHGGKQVSMAHQCHALEGRSVGGMVVHRFLSFSSCAVLSGFDLILMRSRYKRVLATKAGIKLG